MAIVGVLNLSQYTIMIAILYAMTGQIGQINASIVYTVQFGLLFLVFGMISARLYAKMGKRLLLAAYAKAFRFE